MFLIVLKNLNRDVEFEFEDKLCQIVNMKKSIIAAVIAISFLASLIYMTKSSKLPQSIGLVMQSKNIYGFKIQDQLDRPEFLIINFWASWCPPCIQEIPSLLKFVQKNSQYKVVAISQDDGLAEIKSMIKTFPDLKEINFEIVFDETRSLSREFKVEKLPETFIYEYKTQKIMQISGSIDWLSVESKNQIDSFFNN